MKSTELTIQIYFYLNMAMFIGVVTYLVDIYDKMIFEINRIYIYNA